MIATLGITPVVSQSTVLSVDMLVDTRPGVRNGYSVRLAMLRARIGKKNGLILGARNAIMNESTGTAYRCWACGMTVTQDQSHECPGKVGPRPGTGWLDGIGTVRACLDCGVLVAGGLTRCMNCAQKVGPKFTVEYNPAVRAPMDYEIEQGGKLSRPIAYRWPSLRCINDALDDLREHWFEMPETDQAQILAQFNIITKHR